MATAKIRVKIDKVFEVKVPYAYDDYKFVTAVCDGDGKVNARETFDEAVMTEVCDKMTIEEIIELDPREYDED